MVWLCRVPLGVDTRYNRASASTIPANTKQITNPITPIIANIFSFSIFSPFYFLACTPPQLLRGTIVICSKWDRKRTIEHYKKASVEVFLPHSEQMTIPLGVVFGFQIVKIHEIKL